ncbi:hypothetical protein GLOIN_2v1877021 [Rhizophagus clarus]|uniref:F-box domain-containing protein n=1 Tax=Rhizophagus clarus TaxID=94130 RepID=A0A8H3KYW2_9GLOM|nr:hypothetical protein GLOIN_2v1877021 [Rhizophagus clarus]
MTSPRLPNECIYDILKFLKSHRSTLYNCLLVNRFWCKVTISILYANPFKNLTHKKNYKIILNFILCFNEEEILKLKNEFEQVFIIHDINLNNNNNYKPLFNYLKYLKTFHFKIINSVISNWIKYYLNLSHMHNKFYKKFIPLFYDSILIQCNNIKKLNIFLDGDHDICYKICSNQYFISNLTNLNSLDLIIKDNETTQQFLGNIMNLCTKLGGLGISFKPKYSNNRHNNINYIDDTTKEKLYTLIQKQHHLELFKLSYDALLDHQYEILNLASFKLKDLMLIDLDNFYNKIKLNMIKYLGASLQKLLLKGGIPTTPILESVSTYCLNLITLEIDTLSYAYHLSSFSYTGDYSVEKQLFKDLAKLPTSLKEISLFYYLCNPLVSFKYFLDNCHVCLEIINLNGSVNSLLPLEVILNYINRCNNSLKFLGIMGSYNDLNDDELKFLDQIKAKEVIVDFYSVRNYDDDDFTTLNKQSSWNGLIYETYRYVTFIGPWIRNEDMKFKKPDVLTTRNPMSILSKANKMQITDEELNVFGLARDEWNHLVKEEEEAD